MLLLPSVLFLLSLCDAALSMPHGFVNIHKAHGPKVPGSYIVSFKPGVTKADRDGWFQRHQRVHTASQVTHPEWDSTVFNGLAGKFSAAAIADMQLNFDIDYIEEDSVLKTTATPMNQTDAPWGLTRISHKKKPSSTNDFAVNYPYRYDSRAGNGVDIYILDTGINIKHSDFGGRARWGKSFGGYNNTDGNGHGTHVAGIAAGTRYGVAKKASLIAVKALNDTGSGTLSDVIDAMNWVISQAKASKRPSVLNLSLGGGISQSLDNAVTNVVNAGVHVTVAAGNDNTDAGNSSPARAPKAITVGASTITDARAYFSNYGSVVDIFAPGLTITSTWIGSTTATKTISGTSMASPHIAGLIAYIISLNGNMSPAAIQTKLQSLGQDNKLTELPAGTRNELSYNGDGL